MDYVVQEKALYADGTHKARATQGSCHTGIWVRPTCFSTPPSALSSPPSSLTPHRSEWTPQPSEGPELTPQPSEGQLVPQSDFSTAPNAPASSPCASKCARTLRSPLAGWGWGGGGGGGGRGEGGEWGSARPGVCIFSQGSVLSLCSWSHWGHVSHWGRSHWVQR